MLIQYSLITKFKTKLFLRSKCTHSSVQRVPKLTIASLSSSLYLFLIYFLYILYVFRIKKKQVFAFLYIEHRRCDIVKKQCKIQLFNTHEKIYHCLLMLPSLLWSNTLKAAFTSSFKSQLALMGGLMSVPIEHL